MFLPVKDKSGKMALLNIDQIFAIVGDTPNSVIAVSIGGAVFEMPYSLERMEQMLDEADDEED